MLYPQDPLRLDRELSQFAERHARFQTALANGQGEEHAFELKPRSLDDELFAELASARSFDPFADAALDWLSRLGVAHTLIEPTRRLAHAQAVELHPRDVPERGHFTLHELRRRALTDAPRRPAWFDALLATSRRARDLRRELWNAETEAWDRLKLTPPELAAQAEIELAQVTPFLGRSQGAFSELAPRSLSDYAELALGRNAGAAEFPSRLTARELAAWFVEGDWLRGATPELARLPEAYGASSWLRGLWRLGAGLHRAYADRRQPFVLRYDPRGLREGVFGASFALLALNPSFVSRRLGVSRARMNETRRALGRVVLLGARTQALCAGLAPARFQGERAIRDRFGELSAQTFGFELEPEYAELLFQRPRALSDFSALLEAAARLPELREEHDEDWFRNPRAVEQLRVEAASAPRVTATPERLERGARELVALLEALA